jgi:uncharacterized protein YyaL (SSP411 family)
MTSYDPARVGLAAVILSLGVFDSACDRPTAPESNRPPEASVASASNPRLPGFDRVDAELQARLEAAVRAKGPDYRPRTEHLRSDGSPEFTNRLIEQTSPYLVQHAHNPVSWYPWSDEAFERARRENKPVFLSVGYSTCHWCHVMERESFEDEEIAALLNRHFIAIKVDREERPDVDSVYMTAVNLLTGRGGWPMTVIMTPDKEPFFGGTYFPPRPGVRGARTGLIDILNEMGARYRDDPGSVAARAQEVSQQVERASFVQPGPGVPSDTTIVVATSQLAARFDRIDGGFSGAPKFPQPARLTLLLRYARRSGDRGAAAMVMTTLDRMAAGGIYDHVGGGFHRYSTDAQWLVPHFEKMLYDNAQLAALYVEAWQWSGDARHERVAREILDYVLREMTSADGAFFSATDADSLTPRGHEEEGWFFTWTPDELLHALGAEEADLLSEAYGVSPRGNFEGRNVLHRVKSDRELAKRRRASADAVSKRLAGARASLYQARSKRPPPLRDDKIIAAWNGLMISALAQAGWALAEDRYVDAASRAARFVLDRMRGPSDRLVRTSRDGVHSGPGFLDDYAFMVAACLDLYETTGDPAWLEAALALQRDQDEWFSDPDGGYFLTASDAEDLLVRETPVYDGAVPSGNSVAAANLLRLHDLTAQSEWRTRAERLFASVSLRLTRAPTGSPLLLAALDRYYDTPLEVAIIASDGERDGLELARTLRASYVPNKVFLVLDEPAAASQSTLVPWLAAKRSIDGRATAYVCERGRCELPTSDPKRFEKQLAKRTPYPSFSERPPPRLPFERPR